MDWIKAFYPDPTWRKNDTSSKNVADLAKKAVEAIRSDFKLPTCLTENLSSQGQMVAKYLPTDLQTWGIMIGSASSIRAKDSAEKCLFMGWAVDINCHSHFWETHCSNLNRTLLQSLRIQFETEKYC
jgi:hypothetical protein